MKWLVTLQATKPFKGGRKQLVQEADTEQRAMRLAVDNQVYPQWWRIVKCKPYVAVKDSAVGEGETTYRGYLIYPDGAHIISSRWVVPLTRWALLLVSSRQRSSSIRW